MALCGIGALLATCSAHADLILVEHFDYSPGSLAGNGAWSDPDAGDPNEVAVAAGNLSYPGLPDATGSQATFGGEGSDALLVYTNTVSTGTVYASFLLNISDLGSLGTSNTVPLTGIYSSTQSTNLTLQLMVRQDASDTSKVNFGLFLRSDQFLFDTTEFDLEETYLVVLAYAYVPGANNDVAYLWVNPDSSTFGSGTPPAELLSLTSTAGDTRAPLNTWRIYQEGDTTTPMAFLDELRVADDWSNVAPTIPEPGSLVLLPAAALLFGLVRRRRRR